MNEAALKAIKLVDMQIEYIQINLPEVAHWLSIDDVGKFYHDVRASREKMLIKKYKLENSKNKEK